MLTFAANAALHYVHIDDDPSSRGPFTCIVCGVALIAKRGSVMAHHFAHDPGADCVAAGGEGALHLSAKLGLQRVLTQAAAKSGTVLVNVACPCPRDFSVPLITLKPTDRVEVEVRRDALRPDLVVTRAGEDVLVVEVVDTHACSPEKWAVLRAGVAPVLEVAAESLASDDGTFIWNPSTPLPHAGRVLHLPPAPECEECLRREKAMRDERERAEAEQREWKRREEEERRRPRTRILSSGVCYHYATTGNRRKHRLAILLDYEEGEVVRARMEVDDGVRLGTWERPLASDLKEVRAATAECFRQWKARQNRATTVAIEPHWSGLLPPTYVGDAIMEVYDPPQNLWWNASQRRWVRAYTMMHLEDVFPSVKKHTLFNWRRERFKLMPLRAFEGAQETLVMDADEVDGLAKWLAAKRQQPPS